MDAISDLRENKLPLFPGFTDHGIQHLNEVLAAADLFITDYAMTKMSSNDVAALILAVVLHDVAMHLSVAGFQALVRGQSHELPRRANIYFTQEKPWKEVWLDHLSRARRWSSSQLRDVLGRESYPGNPPDDSIDWTIAHHLLAGDFVRAHHPRMAWEFAWIGFPGVEDFIDAFSGANEHVRLVAALTARSHGASIRVGSSWMGEEKYRRRYRGMHPTYLMAVLRLADYIQIHKARADPSIPRLRSIFGSTSTTEWKKHGTSFFEMQVRADTEALEVEAEPDSGTVFLAMQRLFTDIQKEMDATWAVLGEVYGRFEEMPRTLNFRRLRSNLEDVQQFSTLVDYLPAPFSLRPSLRLLPHLVGPLYNHNPTFGYRELLQNAVDAVRERCIVQPGGEYHVEVRIEQGEKGKRLVICDQGVGMTEETIGSYFLIAGASICMSPNWQATFDGSGLLRVGRFGIGVLASFLIAEMITVTTRHWSSKEALRFACRLDANNVEVRRIADVDVGTEIIIEPLSEGVAIKMQNALDEWYCSAHPLVKLMVDGQIIGLSAGIDEKAEQLESAMHLAMDFYPGAEDRRRRLYVNGFRIGHPKEKTILGMPNFTEEIGLLGEIHIADHGHLTPINLQRTWLSYDFRKDERAIRSSLDLLKRLWGQGPRLEEWVRRATPRGMGEFGIVKSVWVNGIMLDKFAWFNGALFLARKEVLFHLSGGKIYNVQVRPAKEWTPHEWLPYMDGPVMMEPFSPHSKLLQSQQEGVCAVYGSYPLLGMHFGEESSPAMEARMENDGRIARRRGDPLPERLPDQLWHSDIRAWSMSLYEASSFADTIIGQCWQDVFPNGLPLAD